MANEWPPRPDEKRPVAPPPPPEIGLRTMQSDIKSVQSGDVAPMSQPVTPPQFSDVMEKVEPDNSASGESVMAAPSSRKSARTMMLVLGVMVIAGGLGLFGYFVVFPKLSSTTPNQEPIVQEPQQPASVTRIPHASYFVKAPAGTETATFTTLTDSGIAAELLKQSVNSPGNDVAKEIFITDSNGSQIAAGAFMSVLTGNKWDSNSVAALFQDDFTTYLYYDKNGVWPGYVLKLKDGVTMESIMMAGKALETGDPTLFYLNPIGLTFQAFKDGKYKNEATRYAPGSQAGASFNYGVFGNYFVVSTAFSGLKAGVALLGL